MNLPVIQLSTAADDLAPDMSEWNADLSSEVLLFSSAAGEFVFVVNGSQLYKIDTELRQRIERHQHDRSSILRILSELGCADSPTDPLRQPAENRIRAVSLAISQKCNLGCSYCYAEQGGFGETQRSMTEIVAFRAIEQLIDDAEENGQVNIAFMGGEPLMNRKLLRAATRYAVELAQPRKVRLALSLTTNGTLVTPDDGEFFEDHAFAVTVSVDGPKEIHDRLRGDKRGRGTFDALMQRVQPLLSGQRRMQVSARVTVTPSNLALCETLDLLVSSGFHSVGFSPMLSSPNGQGQMQASDLDRMLAQLIECGDKFQAQVVKRQRFPFLNMVNAMREIHLGSQRAYPCGAGVSYIGVAADGDYYACHRFVNDPQGWLGNIDSGLDFERQTAWAESRHVQKQQPCSGCWARYLCGGGCHHEVLRRGRPACNFIRGWLEYCLKTYSQLRVTAPWYFEEAS